jgi:CDGSH iron-sulfur domain-containing protein 3
MKGEKVLSMADNDPSTPVVAQKAPYGIEVEAGKTYYWCACGLSGSQPFCDGSHKGTGHVPLAHISDKAERVWFCGCKASANKPLCDGNHKNL